MRIHSSDPGIAEAKVAYFRIGSSTGLCQSSKQSQVTTFSTESELVACADVIPSVEGIKRLNFGQLSFQPWVGN
jgi:hypothetical protein